MALDEAVMRCMTCGTILEVTADAAVIAEEAYWHRRVAHAEFDEMEFATRFPSERSTGSILIKSEGLATEQSRQLAAWDARIERMIFAD